VSRRDDTKQRASLSPNAFHALLALQAGPLHGYAILKSVRTTSRSSVGPGAIYGTLQRLEDAGLVREGERSDPERGASPRQEYEITESGLAALRAEARRLARLAQLAAQRNLLTEGEVP
jgi:DNA-binding PadR family transcriptional regulator